MTNTIEVQREDTYPDGLDVEIEYEERGDGWYVKTPENNEFWRFASPDARERDVWQLINKKWDVTYAVEPDPLDDKS